MTQTLSDKIRNCRDGVVRNPYQGTDKRVVFVCSMGILRSATAARIYAHKYNTRSAGSFDDALIPLTHMLMAWADELVFVNQRNFQDVTDKLDAAAYDFVASKSKILDIPDMYDHMHPELIKAFEEQYEPL